MLRPALHTLRSQGFRSVLYLDDWCLLGSSSRDCLTNVRATCDLLTSLGFFINFEKSQLEPAQSVTFLGVTLHSASMHLHLPVDKQQVLQRRIRRLLEGTHQDMGEFDRVP